MRVCCPQVPRDGAESVDPYLKLYLLPDPDKETKRKTRIARKTLSPTFNETVSPAPLTLALPPHPSPAPQFCFTVPEGRLPRSGLQVSVWDASVLFAKRCLATTAISLHRLGAAGPEGVSRWYDLCEPEAR